MTATHLTADSSPSHPSPATRGSLARLSLIGCLVAHAASAHAQAAPTMITAPTAADPTGDLSRELARQPVADGYFSFVQMVGGDVGVIAQGDRALGTLRGVTTAYRTTPLEIYVAAGGNRSTAPAALVSDDRRRQLAEGPVSPLPTLGTIPASTASAFGLSGLGTVGGAACVDGAMEPFDYFKYWLHGFSFEGVGYLEYIGAHGQFGVGTWSQGAANLSLGSTSAGAALVCFPSFANTDARITVQEYMGNGLWADLWTTHSIYDGAAYGYWFKGYVVHKVRVLIREQDPAHPGPIGPYYWAGAY